MARGTRIDQLFWELAIEEAGMEADLRKASRKAHEEGKKAGQAYGSGFRDIVAGFFQEAGARIFITLSHAAARAIGALVRDSVKEFAAQQKGNDLLRDSFERLEVQVRNVQGRIGEMIVSILGLGKASGEAENIMTRFDNFLAEHRDGIVRLGNILRGLGGIMINTFQLVGDSIVALISGFLIGLRELANGAIRFSNLAAAAFDKVAGTEGNRLELIEPGRATELWDMALNNIEKNFGEARDAAKLFGAEVPPELERTAVTLSKVDKEVEKILNKLKQLRLPVKEAAGDFFNFETRIKNAGLSLVDFIPLADKLGMTVQELGEAVQAEGELFIETFDEQAVAVETMRKILDKYEDDTKDASDAQQKLVRDILDGARAAIDAAQAFGILGSQGAAALNSLVNAGSGVARILQGDLAGGIPSAVAGVAGFIGGIIGGGGPSESQIARDEVRVALDRLRNSVDRLAAVFDTSSGFATSELQRFGRTDISTQFGPAAGTGITSTGRGIQALKDLGISVAELEAFAAAAGIPVDEIVKAMQGLEFHGGAARQQLDGVQAALQAAADAARTLQQDLDTLDLEAQLFGLDPAQVFARTFEAAIPRLGKLGSALFGGVSGADLSTPEGIAAVRDAFRQAFSFLDTADPGALFGNLTRSEFEDLLRDGNRQLEQIEAALEAEGGVAAGDGRAGFQVFKGVTNLTGNRIAGLLTTIAFWTEQTARGVHGQAGNLPAPNTALIDNMPTVPGLAGAPAVSAASGTPGAPNITYAPVTNVQVAGGMDAAAIGAEVNRQMVNARDDFLSTVVPRLDERMGQRRQQLRRAEVGKLN